MYLVTWKTRTICRDWRDSFTVDHNAVAATEQEAAAFVEWIKDHICATNLYEAPRYSKVCTVEEYQKLYEANGQRSDTH